VSGVLQNTGQSLVFRVEKDSKHQVNISGGPLSYRYQFEEIYFHYGMEDNRGSEHQIDHHTFPGEIQLYGFNKELYHNMSEAQHKSQGIVGISLMVQVGEPINTDFRLITSAFNKVTYRGASFPIKHLPLSSLLPNTQQYLTYEGSTTHPGCWETAVWIIFNKPIYISKQEMYALRQLMQGSQLTPKAPLGNNARPVQPLHHRTVRTNINFNKQGLQGSSNCPDMYRNMHYTEGSETLLSIPSETIANVTTMTTTTPASLVNVTESNDLKGREFDPFDPRLLSIKLDVVFSLNGLEVRTLSHCI
ncbi:hypothetical protein SFRURICE_018026, partial [Spodoptera frugiperda]